MTKLKMQLLAASCLVFPFKIGAQNLSYSIEGGLNRSTQLLYNPNLPQDGTTQLNAAAGWHAGINVTGSDLFHSKIPDFFTYKARFAYARRGAVQPAQLSEFPLWPASPGGITQVPSTEYLNIKNTLDYICLDVIIQKSLFHFSAKSAIFLEGGFGNNLLVRSDLKTGGLIGHSYPYDRYNDQSLKRYNLSWIAGLGINIEDRFTLFAQSNKAFTPVHHSSSLRVKDWSWTLGAAINIASHSHQSKENR